LLGTGADVNHLPANGGSALALAARLNRTDVVHLLIEKSNQACLEDAIEAASERGSAEILQLLKDASASRKAAQH